MRLPSNVDIGRVTGRTSWVHVKDGPNFYALKAKARSVHMPLMGYRSMGGTGSS